MRSRASAETIFNKSARGVGWTLAWRLATRLLGLISTLVLVRVLSPADFGLVALATGIANAVEQFGWLGVEGAIVREKAPGREVYDTGFTINVCRSLILAGVIAAAAAPAAAFFHEPRLREIMLFLAAASACMGAENIGVVDFRRDFAFDREFRYLLLPRIASIALAIGAALLFHSYWALVVGIVSARLLRVATSYIMHPFRARFSLRAWRVLIGYSTWMWLLGLAALMRERADTMVIGRALSTVQVGIYTIGFDFAALSFTEFVEALQRPAFSGFVAARNAGLSCREPLLRLLGSVSLITLPAGIGLSLVAGPVIRLVAGERWAAAVPVVQILAAAGVFVVAGTLCRTLLTAAGRFRTMATIVLAVGALRITGLLVAIPLAGLPGAAVAAGSAMVLESVLFVVAVWRRERLALRDLAAPVWRPALACLVMAAGLWGTGLLSPRDGVGPAAALGSAVAVGAVLYCGTLFGLWRLCGRPLGAEADALRLIATRLRRMPA